MKYNGKFSATWVYENHERTYYLVPVSVANTFNPYRDNPFFATITTSPSSKKVEVLGATVWNLDHLADEGGHYLNIAKAEVIKALRRWGIDIEEVEDADR